MNVPATPSIDPDRFRQSLIDCGGEAGRLIAARDWSATPLGPVESWPPSLRTALGLILRSPVPMVMLWGPDGVMLYNDAYSVFAGGRHPELLGSKVREGWPEVADFNDNVMRVGLAGGTLAYRDQELTLYRHGRPEQVFMNLDYSPVPGEDGQPAGVLAVVVETTERVLAERRRAAEHERLVKTYEQAPGIIAMLEGPQHVFVLANAAYRELVGQRDVIGKPVRVALPEVEGQGFVELLDHVYASGEPFRGEAVAVRLDRVPGQAPEERFIDFIYQPVTGDDGRIGGIFVEGYDVTERVRVQSASLESELRFRAAVDAVEGVIWTNNAAGEMVGEQPGWAALTGQSYEEYQGFGWVGAVHPDDAQGSIEAWREAVAQRKTLIHEHRVRRRDGAWRMFSIRAIPTLDAEGRVREWVGVHTDVTELRAREAELRELNETLERRVGEALVERKLLADVFQSTDAMIAVADPDLRLLAFNRAYDREISRLSGSRPRIGQRIPDLYAGMPEVAAATEEVWSRALSGESYTVVQEFGDPARLRVPYEMRFEPLYDREGRFIGAFQYSTDVSERLRDQQRIAEAEAAQREADALYRAYFQNSAEGLFVVAVLPEGGFSILEVNPAHRTVLGLDLAAAPGRRIEEQLPPEVAGPMDAHFRRVVETGQPQRYRESAEIGGRVVHAETVLVPVRDQEGRIARIVGSSRGMTAQVQAEEALRQSQKMEAVGQLTGGIAHDFNNLLTPILGGLDIVRRRVTDERSERLIGAALQAAERAKTLVSRLLAFARRQTLQPRAVRPAELIEGLRELIERSLGPSIEVTLDVPEDLPPVLVDPNQLELALLNLSVNARDAMPGGGKLTITAEARDAADCPVPGLAPGTYIRLTVTDTGIGMDEATLSRAIEPFFSTKGMGKGTGLGLSMVHGLAAQSGGLFKLASRVGVGTTAVLWLPVAAEEAESEPPVEVPAPKAPRPSVVLLVDDEPLVRISTAESLRELGYEVVEVGTAAEALEVLRVGLLPDAVVTDHMMPGMTGAQLAADLRRMVPGLPVLIVTGYANLPPEQTRGLTVLSKPFRQADLARLLAGMLTGDGRVVPLRSRAAKGPES